MENKNLPAFPQPIAECNGGLSETMDYNNLSIGLSKREYFAGLAMQGLASHPSVKFSTTAENFSKYSVAMADALLLELSKPQP